MGVFVPVPVGFPPSPVLRDILPVLTPWPALHRVCARSSSRAVLLLHGLRIGERGSASSGLSIFLDPHCPPSPLLKQNNKQYMYK